MQIREVLGDDLEAWMADSSLLRRTFRNVAVIAGLIDRRQPGQQKTSRQVTFSSDLIYDVLRSHEPNHVLLRATRADAAAGLTDIRRLLGTEEGALGKLLQARLEELDGEIAELLKQKKVNRIIGIGPIEIT